MSHTKEIAERFVVDPQARRVGDPQLLDAFGPTNRNFRRDPAAEADAAEMDLLQAERVEHVDVVEGKVLDRVDLVEPAAPPEAGMRRH